MDLTHYNSLKGLLSDWYEKNKRSLPWREKNDPYSIWLSEIILQQTRVNQGIDYYFAFLNHFPDIHSLARAPIDEVLKLWQGLGYYSRAINLHKAAKIVSIEYDGYFPKDYNKIIHLPGIGKYTAAAIASFAFNQPYAVVDGNVIRFLTRYFGIKDDVRSSGTVNQVQEIANQVLDVDNPALHNQAIMEFGSQYCTITNPNCFECKFYHSCYAAQNHEVKSIPFKSKPKQKRIRYFTFIVPKILVGKDTHTLLHKRSNKDIWHGLYQFPLIESNGNQSIESTMANALFKRTTEGADKKKVGKTVFYKHILTHQEIRCNFVSVDFELAQIPDTNEFILVNAKHIDNFAVPRVIERYLIDNKIFT